MNRLIKLWELGSWGIGIAAAGFGCSDPAVCGVGPCASATEPFDETSAGSAGEGAAAGAAGSINETGSASGGSASAGTGSGGSAAGGAELGENSAGNGGAAGAGGQNSQAGMGGETTMPEPQLANCADGQSNGDETDVDCGGSCDSPCGNGKVCTVSGDCASAICSDSVCATPSCGDGVVNGNETAVDCGGACDTFCADGLACALGSDCTSGSCVASLCVAASCSDGATNGTETDLDCGGMCTPCERGLACSSVTDCNTASCFGGLCVLGPTSGFGLSATSGPPPFSVSATSTAVAGDAALATTTYQFEAGQVFATLATHTYAVAGNYTVTQRVTDANGLISEAASAVFVTNAAAGGVLFSETDTSFEITVAEDGLTLEFGGFDRIGARTETSVAPGTGFFYYEGQRLSEPYFFSFGVVTADFDLTDAPGETSQSVGVETTEGVRFNAATLGGFNTDNVEHYGFAVDYRGTSPIVYVIAGGSLVGTATLAVTTPVFAFAGGLRSIVGPQLRINTGNDTQNFPFFYDVAAILTANSISPAELVLGFGATNAAAPSAAPVLSVQGEGSVALGGTVNLTATATDTEDGNMAGNIRWVDLSLPYAERPVLTGGAVSFTLDTLGIHPIEVSVADNSGLVTRQVVDITVTGTLPQFSPVQLLADARSGDGIVVSADGLSAKFFSSDKYGIRANQGLLGAYQYFEIHRLGGIVNQGGGLVIAEGNLDPYSPLDVPASCSVNYSTRVWRNLISVASYDEPATEFYGFAVDYRGRTPLVHVITETALGAELAVTLDLDDVTVPIYPLLYGNPIGGVLPDDATMNFAGPFHYAPATVLGGAGVDVTGLQVSWGG